ncbi:MAG: type II toxin-antitoxin system VapC family toxin [Methylococcales bacterium]|nr:type II toxin-antitoxin system VapC family toxin [Methylococcales bacterium]
MYMLDTNICIDIKNNKPPRVLEKLQSLNANQVCMSSITDTELFYGAMKSQHPIKNIEQIIALKNAIPILNFNESAAEKYGEIRADLEKQGLVIGSNDLLIAAHALSEQCVLVSNNLREFNRVKNLQTENWT